MICLWRIHNCLLRKIYKQGQCLQKCKLSHTPEIKHLDTAHTNNTIFITTAHKSKSVHKEFVCLACVVVWGKYCFAFVKVVKYLPSLRQPSAVLFGVGPTSKSQQRFPAYDRTSTLLSSSECRDVSFGVRGKPISKQACLETTGARTHARTHAPLASTHRTSANDNARFRRTRIIQYVYVTF